MKIRLSDRALAYLKREQGYLAKFDKRVALAVVRQIRAATKLIGEHPQIGPVIDGAKGVRRYISAPYQIDYQEDDVGIMVVAIRHGRQAPREVEAEYPQFKLD
ncbi:MULTISPECIES: type II toxin-antitoxin system RelE/ParE family toxin [Rhizobiaceae]|jgi:plasmid stabilization system protein ParE|uniref:Plasmid stabilization system protein ParE n=1 Tax=Aliirhizobium cellulosilyticum TaxID=393664 RepID=A0A7W6WPB2_9HYPH|nr:type II toxin-antitoxin system RelE/ParE family toxin [Rhizobium cellulosilyticum]MBB4348167.1 plasmid stabilization system protein ParE [Rhizobium cellulosilyticum]MBB4411404.1 plasmid stabilization system protein ParE [Rhizobium cellulosilyticum]MBB4446093.1 plasmid stabilization system protein ParE [Rhizobium cellulosilyticum]